MATYTVEEQVQQLYVGLLGRAADKSGFDYWVNEIESGNMTLESVRSNFVNEQPEGQAIYDSGKSREEIVAVLYDNLFGREPGENAQYWISGEGADVPADLLVYALINGAGENDRTVLDQSVADAQEETNDDDGEAPSNPVNTIELTENRDFKQGTDADDLFLGMYGQNQDGSTSNALSTGDRLDGGAGRDMIQASMMQDNEVDDGQNLAPRPNTQNIEEVYIEALENVTLDATRMENVEEYWADFGRGDLTINNVNLQGSNLNITKDVTFGIRDTQFDTNFTASFDSQSLLRAPEEAANSQLLIRIADVSTETPETPLANVSVTLGFELAGEEFTLANVVSTDGTYQGLVEAINAALAEQGLGSLDVQLSTQYEQVTVAGNTVNLPFTAQEILITDPDGQEFGEVDFTQAAIESVEGGFLVAGNADPVDPTVTSNLIETNLILDNAGRGSTAGDVTIGGESNSDIGVERFNVTVDRGSKIASLVQTATNSDELEEIYIDSTGADGSLYVGAVDADLEVINATGFDGADLSIGEATAVSDLESFNSAGSSANVTFVADYNGNGDASSEQSFTINTGSGNDSIEASLVGTSTSGSTTANLTLNSTGGNNVVSLSSNDTEVNEATVVLGSGADTVTGGATHLTANTGAGNDVIYAENTGDKSFAQLDAGGLFSATATTASTSVDIVQSQLLYGRQVQVTVAMPEEAPVASADSFIDGYEVTAEIQASNGYLTTERDLYEAAARAINEDPMVNKLVEATVDSNGHLQVQYLVDGVSVAADQMVELEVLGDWAAVAGNQSNILADIQEAYSNSDITAAELETIYNGVNTIDDYAVIVAGTPSVFTVDLNGLTATAGNGGDIIFNIGGDTVTLTEGGAADFTGQANATDLAAELEANVGTVTIGGETYDIAQVGTTSEVTLTTTTGSDDTATVSVTSTQGGAVTNTGTQTTVGVDGGVGTDSTTAGVNDVEAGTGNDVVVLSSNDSTVDTIDFGQGGFGNDVIVHYNDAANGDVLDFTQYLDNVVTSSGSTASQTRVATSFTDMTGSLGSIGENDVVVTQLEEIDGSTAATVDFASLTDAQVLEALNTGASAAATASGFVGNIQKSIVMVENFDGTEGNEGEYKVYEVSYDTTADSGSGAFTQASLVGTADFGDQLDTGSMDDTNVA